ncbi:MAG: hypothetical protein IPN19_15350 [Elusimicrobia bacterium]|nr:hypothetical protein [Elusimicrobiota bacterium]
MASLAGSPGGLAMTAGAALSVSALASSFMSANREAGLLRASLETVTGSVAKATTAWEVLQGFAAQTPYSLEQAVQGFIKLKSMGLDPSMAALTSYGNTAGAMGKSLNQMIEAVADAATGEFERLKEFGIKAKQNGDEVSLTFQGVTTTIGNNAQAIEKYLLDIGNVQFAGGMERQAKTLEGSISNLGDAWDQFWVKMGDTGLTQGVIAVLNDVSSGIASLGEGMTGANGVASAFGSTMTSLGASIATTYNELKTGVWSDTTTAIAATAGAIGGAIGLMTALSAAVGIATGVWGVFTAILLANPITLAIAGIGALIGVLYTLRDETITIGQTTTTVGATVSAVWETTASYSGAVWDTFSGYVAGVFNSVVAYRHMASAVLSARISTMSGLMSATSSAVNYVMNLFRWIGRSAGVLAGEIAMTLESGFNFDRLKQGLADEAKYTDMLAKAGKRAAAGIAAASQEIAKKADNIRAVNQVESDYAELERELAADNAKAAMAAKLHAFEQANLAGAHGKAGAGAKAGAAAAKGAGAANNTAAKAANKYASELDALIKKYLPARDDAENLAEATAVLDKAMAKGDITGTEYGEMLKKLKKDYDTAGNAAEDLIDKYDREGAAARTLKEDSDALNKIIAEGGPAAERAKVALEELGEQQAKNGKDANAWSEVWKNAVKRIDDTFAGLWKDLFSGTKTTLESLKNAILSWLAEVAHALLTKPLVVAITTSMVGGSSVAGAAGQAASGECTWRLQLLSPIGSMFSTAFQLGSTFLSGVAEGVMGMFSTNMFSTIGTAWGAATSGSAMGAAAGAGVIAAYALPLVAAGALILNKYFKDQEPRYGAYGATTTGRTDQFEGGLGVKGAFGLTFGMNDMGTANVDPEEQRALLEGFAKVSQAMADFYGKDVEAAVKASLEKASMENWGKNGLMNYAANAEQALQIAFTDIIKHAAATGDAVAVVMSSVVGSLQGTMEDMANQIERGMLAAKAAVGMAEAFQGQEMGTRLGLDNKDTLGNALKLVDYANTMKQAGETTAEAIGRMALNLTGLDAAMTLSGFKIGATGQAFIDVANQLAAAADAAGIGMQGLLQLQSFYAEQFFGPQKIFAHQAHAAQQEIDRTFKELGQSLVIPTDREAFMDLVEGLDLTTEAGRAAYVAMMQLGPAFDALFDSQEKFTNWIDPIDPAKKAMAEMTDIFRKWGMTLPANKDALLALYKSGKLTTEQMAILGSHLDELKLLFPELADSISKIKGPIVDLTDLHIRLAKTLGNEAGALAMQRRQELDQAGDDASRAMMLMIYAAEDLAKRVDENGKPIATPNFNTALLTALAREMGKGYTNFDSNRDKTISGMELTDALGPLAGKEEIARLMAVLDKNGDGQIGALEQLPLLIASNLAPLFEKFDKNKDGSLSLEELRTALNGVVDDKQLKAIYELLDENGDGLIDKLEAVRLNLYTSLRDVVSGLDASGDKRLGKDELLKALVNVKYPEAWVKKIFDVLDKDRDGLLTAAESVVLSVANSLSEKFGLVDADKNGQLSFSELQKSYKGIMTDAQIKDLIKIADVNGDGQISMAEASNLKLDIIAAKAEKLSDVVKAVESQKTAMVNNLGWINKTLLNGFGNLSRILTPKPVSAMETDPGVAVNNLIQSEAGDSADLRTAIAQLNDELQALRQSQERTENARQATAASLAQATDSLAAAVTSIPSRIEVETVVTSLGGEAGY